MRRVVVLVGIGACGRSGFGPAIDASNADDVIIDPFDAPTGSTVVTLGETSTANVHGVTADTRLSSESSSSNYGASTRLSLEGNSKPALLRFDLSSLPPGVQLFSARLHLYATSIENSTTVSIAPVLEAWTEGTQNGSAGAANYTQRTATQNWANAGAGSPNSRGATIASIQLMAVGSIGVDLPPATVQAWIDSPSTNDGLVLSSSGGDASFASREEPTTASRPEIVITYFP